MFISKWIYKLHISKNIKPMTFKVTIKTWMILSCWKTNLLLTTWRRCWFLPQSCFGVLTLTLHQQHTESFESPGSLHAGCIPNIMSLNGLYICSVAPLHPTFCDPMDCIMPGLPVLHHLPESAQTHVHRVGNAIQPSHPLLSPSPPAFYLFQNQGLFQLVGS